MERGRGGNRRAASRGVKERGRGHRGGRSVFKKNSPSDPRVGSEVQIFVEGLPPLSKIPELVQYFSTVGEIKIDRDSKKPRVWLYTDKVTGQQTGEATITYKNPYTQKLALSTYHLQQYQGKTIMVTPSIVKAHMATIPDLRTRGRGRGRGRGACRGGGIESNRAAGGGKISSHRGVRGNERRAGNMNRSDRGWGGNMHGATDFNNWDVRFGGYSSDGIGSYGGSRGGGHNSLGFGRNDCYSRGKQGLGGWSIRGGMSSVGFPSNNRSSNNQKPIPLFSGNYERGSGGQYLGTGTFNSGRGRGTFIRDHRYQPY